MAMWDKIKSSGNVQDRRAAGPAVLGGGLGVAGIAIVLLVNLLGGGDVGDVLNTLNQFQNAQTQATQSYDAKDFEGADTYEIFVSKVLGSANDMWSNIFSQGEMEYTEPTLVLFRGSTQSACGGADSSTGPHYCPVDETIYLDETFFDELQKRFGAQGGDVAEAYVVAHEVGHHVQNELGSLSGRNSNEESIQVELQADCFAGLWAYSIKHLGVFEPGEIQEAIDAAAAVGDDRIQASSTGRVNPETWTHGSSAERMEAFNRGYETGSVTACDIQ